MQPLYRNIFRLKNFINISRITNNQQGLTNKEKTLFLALKIEKMILGRKIHAFVSVATLPVATTTTLWG